MFSIYLIAFILLSSLGTDFFKTIAVVLLGLLFATIGMDPLTGVLRFTHGIKHLYHGPGFIPIAMGAFGMGEILSATQESVEGRMVHKVKLREPLAHPGRTAGILGPHFSGVRDRIFHRSLAGFRSCGFQLPQLPR